MKYLPHKGSAKEALKDLAIKIDRRLEKYWETEINKKFGFDESQIKLVSKVLEHAKEHNLRQAKRLRGSLVYYGYLLGGKEPNEEIEKVMEAVELVQTALLMHDDFMDEDKLRRGLPATQEYFAQGDKHYGESMAVDVGDVVLCLGFERMLECKLDRIKTLKAAKLLMRGIVETALGQAFDVSLPKLGNLTENKVLAVHKAKTAIYTFQNPLLVGGVLAGLAEKDLEILKKYSEAAGVAFQLRDDVLGMYGDVDKTGKSSDSDLLQGKSTLLVVKALEVGNEEQRAAILKAWGKREATKKEIEVAKKAIVDSGSYKYSLDKAKELIEEALVSTESLRKRKLNTEAINYLRGIAEYIAVRKA